MQYPALIPHCLVMEPEDISDLPLIYSKDLTEKLLTETSCWSWFEWSFTDVAVEKEYMTSGAFFY